MSNAQKIAGEIYKSRRVCVLTGAGISTESGIPDFRSPGTGLWSRFDPNILSADSLLRDPEKFYSKGLKVLKSIGKIKEAEPNIGHKVLAKLEKENYIDCIITQNIDGLHRKAGSKKVYEVHGNLRDAYCMSCGRKYSFSDIIEKIKIGQMPPQCGSCNGTIRPDVVLFGDVLNESYSQAVKEVEKCNLLVIVGSSLEVSPVNYLPDLAARYIIINREPTSFDRDAFISWQQQAGKALEMIYNALKEYEKKG
ncbi:MAG: SIR2 family NAD-dependent protein deacylase [Actinomycetota bacterium]